MINRLILWLSLAGMILALHLWIQKARGFDQGCLGLSKPVFVAPQGCVEVSELPASHLFGVSNAAWVFAFYFALALISVAKMVAAPGGARRLHGISEIAVALAALYSGYLIYTMVFIAGAFCLLCLTSSLLVLTLVALHVVLRRRGGFQPIAESARGTELGLAVAGMFAATGMLVGVLLFINRLGTRPLDQGTTAQDFEQLVGQSLPLFIDRERLAEMQACRFDPWAPAIDWKKIVGPGLPFLGRPDGVSVVVFYDPNCPHCAAFHPQFLKLVERFKDRARFQVVPRSLWDLSLRQTQALKLAEPSGKYFELWQRMFERQKKAPAAMTDLEIAAQFRDLGLEASDLEKRLEGVKAAVVEAGKRVKAAGVAGLPALYIEGRRVLGPNYAADCVAKLIDRMQPSGAVEPAVQPRP